jgi:hypothetical protein
MFSPVLNVKLRKFGCLHLGADSGLTFLGFFIFVNTQKLEV